MSVLMRPFIILSFILSLGFYNQAWSFTTQIKQSYYLGDGDSRVAAREMLINQIKQQAASQAGSYIQADKKLDESGRYTETITALSASLVKVKPLSEVYGSDSKGIYLTINAQVDVDESELRKRIQAMQSDQSKAKALTELQAENQTLVKDLQRLKIALADRTLTLEQANNLARQQSEVYQRIERNQAAAQSVFNQGTLLTMAQQNADREKQVREQFAQEYKQLWQDLSRQLKPVIHSVNGNEVIVKIENFRPVEPVDKLLGSGRFFPFNSTRSELISTHRISDMPDAVKKKIKAVAPYIIQKPVFLEVEIAGVKKAAQVFGYFNSGFFGSDPVTPSKTLNLKDYEDAIFGNGYSDARLGFINKESYKNTNWYIQEQTIFFRFNLTDQQMNTADRIEARYRI